MPTTRKMSGRSGNERRRESLLAPNATGMRRQTLAHRGPPNNTGGSLGQEPSINAYKREHFPIFCLIFVRSRRRSHGSKAMLHAHEAFPTASSSRRLTLGPVDPGASARFGSVRD